MLVSCQSCPKNSEEEVKGYLTVSYFPELIDIQSFSPLEKREILEYMLDAYEAHLTLLLSCKTTDAFIPDELDKEIAYCKEAIAWIDSLGIVD